MKLSDNRLGIERKESAKKKPVPMARAISTFAVALTLAAGASGCKVSEPEVKAVEQAPANVSFSETVWGALAEKCKSDSESTFLSPKERVTMRNGLELEYLSKTDNVVTLFILVKGKYLGATSLDYGTDFLFFNPAEKDSDPRNRTTGTDLHGIICPPETQDERQLRVVVMKEEQVKSLAEGKMEELKRKTEFAAKRQRLQQMLRQLDDDEAKQGRKNSDAGK